MTMWNNVSMFYTFIKNRKLGNFIYISIHCLCLILCWYTFGIWWHKRSTTMFKKFHPFFCEILLKLHEVGRETSVRKFSNRTRNVQLDSSQNSDLAVPGPSHSFEILATHFGSSPCWKMLNFMAKAVNTYINVISLKKTNKQTNLDLD